MKSQANKLLVSTIKKLIHRGAGSQLDNIIARSHPADLAYVFNFLTSDERRLFFERIDEPDTAANILAEAEPLVLRDFLATMEPRPLVKLLEAMSPDDTADVLEQIEDEERRELLLTMMHREELATTQSLMEYDPESAGGLMVPDFFALEESITAREALRRLQEDAGRTEVVFYLYVINEHGHLVGVTSLRELVLARPEALLADFMISDLVRVDVSTDQEEVARLIARYNLVALPVVDGNNQLVGVVTVDDIIDVIRLEATEDMMLMAGAGDQQVEVLRVSALRSIRTRLPWMLPSFVGGSAALLLLWGARQDVARLPLLAALIPLVMMLSGNVGTQSSAIITRGLALGRTDFSGLGKVVLGEMLVGAGLGVAWGALLSAVSYFLVDGPSALEPRRFASSAGLCVVLSMAIASTLGALMPMIFARLNLDPAVATGPFVTTLVDFLAVATCLAILTSLI